MVRTSPVTVTETSAGKAGAVSGEGQLTAAPDVVQAAADGELDDTGVFAALPLVDAPHAASVSATEVTAIARPIDFITRRTWAGPPRLRGFEKAGIRPPGRWRTPVTRSRGVARIALVHDVAGVAATQAEILRAAGHDVDHIDMPRFGSRWSWLVKGLTLPIRLLLYLPVVLKLRRGRYDVIHIPWGPRRILGLLAGKPFFIQAHGSDLHVELKAPGVFRLNRRVLEAAQKIFYVTPNLEPYVARFSDKLVYLPNP